MTISSYPVTYFVDARGILIPASGTDQANWSDLEAKRVRTVTDEAQGRRIVVTIGQWYSSQHGSKSMREAIAFAAQEAATIEQSGHYVRRARVDCAGAEFEDLVRWPAPGPKPHRNSRLVQALRMVMVEGFAVTDAARVAGLSAAAKDRGHKTVTNGRRQLQRALKAWRGRLAEMRRMSAMAA